MRTILVAAALATGFFVEGVCLFGQQAEIPRELQDRINRQGCVNTPSLERSTIVSGEFVARGQRDWMVACALSDSDWAIFHYWGGTARCEGDLVRLRPNTKLAKSPIAEMRVAAGQDQRQTPPLNHDGLVEDDASERVTLYCTGRIWAVVSQHSHYDPESVAAAARVSRLAARSFPKIPEPIRRRIEADGCRVPQISFAKQPNNAIAGQFAKQGQTDWAILCSRNDRTSIRIYWGGSATCQPIDMPRDDIEFLEDDEFAYSLSTASITQLREAAAAHPEEAPLINGRLPPLTHDGIDFGSEKASTASYCNGGRWISFLTGD